MLPFVNVDIDLSFIEQCVHLLHQLHLSQAIQTLASRTLYIVKVFGIFNPLITSGLNMMEIYMPECNVFLSLDS